jgi:hypothetical protein
MVLDDGDVVMIIVIMIIIMMMMMMMMMKKDVRGMGWRWGFEPDSHENIRQIIIRLSVIDVHSELQRCCGSH